MRILNLSLSQTQPQPGHFYYASIIFYVCLIKAIINYYYWRSAWILFNAKIYTVHILAKVEPENYRDVWLSLQAFMCIFHE